MGRRGRFDESRVLDAALVELAAHGPRGVTISAIARALGAPSGSLYYRFPTRDDLVATLWLRTVERFQSGYMAAWDGADAPLERLDAAVRFVVRWCTEHPREAQLLTLYRREDLVTGQWPDHITAGSRRLAAVLEEGFQRLATALAVDDLALLRLAAVSIPQGAVRPYLRSGKPIPAGLEAAVVRAARAALQA